MSAVASSSGIVPQQSSEGVSSRAMHRIHSVAGVGAWSRTGSTSVFARRVVTSAGKARKSTFPRAALAPGGYTVHKTETQDRRFEKTSVDSVTAYHTFTRPQTRVLRRRIVVRASTDDDTPNDGSTDRGRYLKRGASGVVSNAPKLGPFSKLLAIGDDSSSTARDALAAVTVAYAFAAWKVLQWPAASPINSAVPPPLVAFAVAAGATAIVAPLLAAAAHPAANYGVRFPLLARAAFGVEGARALTSARRLVCSALCAGHFLAGANAMHVLAATVAPAASVLGSGAWSSAGCYLLAWLAQSPAGGAFCRAVLVKLGGAFAIVAALSAAKVAAFGPAIVAKANVTAAAANGTSSLFSGSMASLDIGLGLVSVWFVMSSSFLDTTASATVAAATEASKLGKALPPAGERAARYAKRLPIAAALAAVVVSSALNPSGAFGAEIGSKLSSWMFPLLVAVAAPSATSVIRGGGANFGGKGSTTISDANVALFAAASTIFVSGVPSRSVDALAAFAGGSAFAVATAFVAPTMAIALTDYFLVRKRAIDTAALVDGKDKNGDFWFKNGFNPRAVFAAVIGAAVPLMDFAVTAEIGCRMVGVVGPGVSSIIAPGVALARGAGAGGLIASAAYLAFNALAPPPRVSSSGGSNARGRAPNARVISDDGTATGTSVDETLASERQAEVDSLTVDGTIGTGSESKGERWMRQNQNQSGPGGPENDDDDERDDDTTRFDRARSRLERLLEMESASGASERSLQKDSTRNSQNSQSPRDSLLGASLRAELESHLERRRLRLGELRAEQSAKGKRFVSDEAIARVQADVDALMSEIKQFEQEDVSGRLVRRAADEINRVRAANSDTSASGGYLNFAGTWREVSKCASEVTKLDVEMEKLAARASVTGKPYSQNEMQELRDRRSAWGLRLVSAQIKGVSNVKAAVEKLDQNGNSSKKTFSESEVTRLEVLKEEKTELLKRLTEKEAQGATASDAAKKLRAEVLSLRQQLKGATDKAQLSETKISQATLVLETKLADAEKAKFKLKMRAETEASRLYSKIVSLQKTVTEREDEVALMRKELEDSKASNVTLTKTNAELTEKVKSNELEIQSLKSNLKSLRLEMAEKDKQYAAATALLKAQLVETKEALESSEIRLNRAKERSLELETQREQEKLDAAAAAKTAERKRLDAEARAEIARAEALELEKALLDVEGRLVESEKASEQASAAAQKAVEDAKNAELRREEETRVAVRNMRGAEKALAEKEEALRLALADRDAKPDTEMQSLQSLTEKETLDLEKAALETEFAAERAAAAELGLEKATKKVAELEATEALLAERARAAQGKATSLETEAATLRSSLEARETLFSSQEKQWNEREADMIERQKLAESAAENARLELEAVKLDAAEKTAAKLEAEKRLAKVTAEAASTLEGRSISDQRLGIAANVLRRVAAAMGGTPDEAWTPARVEQALFDRLETLERALVDAKTNATAVYEENLNQANDTLRSVIAELDETRAELDATRDAARERDAAAAAAAASDAKTRAAEEKARTVALRLQLESARQDAEEAQASRVEAERRALVEAAGAKEASSKLEQTRKKAKQALAVSNSETAAAKDDARRLAAALARREAALDAREREMREMKAPSEASKQQSRLTRWTVDFFSGFSSDDSPDGRTNANSSVPLSTRLEALLAKTSKELQELRGDDVAGAIEIESALKAVGTAAGEAAQLETELESAKASLRTAEASAAQAREKTREAEQKRDELAKDAKSKANDSNSKLQALRSQTESLKSKLANAETAAKQARAESETRATRAEALLAGRVVADKNARTKADITVENAKAVSEKAVRETEAASEREAELIVAVQAAEAALVKSREEKTEAEKARVFSKNALVSTEAKLTELSVSESENLELIATLRSDANKFAEESKQATEKANALVAELEQTRASLTEATESLAAKEEASVVELKRLEALVESERQVELAATQAANSAVESADASEAKSKSMADSIASKSTSVLSKIEKENENLKAEVTRLEAALVQTSEKAEKALAKLEQDVKQSNAASSDRSESSSSPSLFSRATRFFEKTIDVTIDAGKSAKIDFKNGRSAKVLANKLRTLLDEIDEPDPRTFRDENVPELTKQTVEASMEVWATLDAVREELSVLKGVELALSDTKEKLKLSEQTVVDLQSKLTPLEDKLIEVKASYVDAMDLSEKTESALRQRIQSLETEKTVSRQSSASAAVEVERLKAELLVSTSTAKRAAEAESLAAAKLETAKKQITAEVEAVLEASRISVEQSERDLLFVRQELIQVQQARKKSETDAKTLSDAKREAVEKSKALRVKADAAEKRAATAEANLSSATRQALDSSKTFKADKQALSEASDAAEKRFRKDLRAAREELADAVVARAKAEGESLKLRRAAEDAERRAAEFETEAAKVSKARVTVEPVNIDTPVVATLQGELALARADLTETRTAFELVQSASREAVAAETELSERVAELEAKLVKVQQEKTSEMAETAEKTAKSAQAEKSVPTPPFTDPSSEKIKTLEASVEESKKALAEAVRTRKLAESKTEELEAWAVVDKKKAETLESEIEVALAEAEEARETRDLAEREVNSLREQLEKVKEISVEVSKESDTKSVTSTSSTSQEVQTVIKSANISVDALRRAFEERGAELERRVRVVFDKEAQAAQEWADVLTANNTLIAEKDEEVLLYMKRCEVLEARLNAATSARVAAELFATRRVEIQQTRETKTLLKEIVALKTELEETKILERQATAALQIIKQSFEVDSDVSFSTSDVVTLSSRAAKVARMDAEVSAKEADLLERELAVDSSESDSLKANAFEFKKLTAEKAALAVKAKRAAENANAANEKVSALEKKIAAAELAFEKETNELRFTLANAESKVSAAQSNSDELTRLRAEAREVMTLRETIEAMQVKLSDADAATQKEKQKTSSLAKKTEALEFEVSALESKQSCETSELKGEIERVKVALANAQIKVTDLERSAALHLLSAKDAGAAFEAAKLEAEQFEKETQTLREQNSALEEQVADREKTLIARLQELDGAKNELDELRTLLSKREKQLAEAEQVRDDALLKLDGKKGSSQKSKGKSKSTSGAGSASGPTPTRPTPTAPADRTGTAAWAAANAGLAGREGVSFAVNNLQSTQESTKELQSTQAEVEERLRAAQESWSLRERDLRRRVRQLEAASAAFDFQASVEQKQNGPIGEVSSKESLRILAEQAEVALRRREVELSTARAAEQKARKDANDALVRMAQEVMKAKKAADAADFEFRKLKKEKDAEAAVRATLENTLREQIAAYERVKEEKSGSSEKEDSDGDKMSWARDETTGPREPDDVSFLRAEVERLNAALDARSEVLHKARAELEDRPPGGGSSRGPGDSNRKETKDGDVLVPSAQVLVVEKAMLAARGEAASLRSRLEAKERELAERAVREKQLAVAEKTLRARVADLSSELQAASAGYDAELQRVGLELAQLQQSLTARETSVENMQNRIDRQVESDTIKRNKEISDARSELSKMQVALENMARDVQKKKDVERKLSETSQKLRDAENANETSSSKVLDLESKMKRLVGSLEDKKMELVKAQAETNAVREKLELASKSVGVAPQKLWVDETEKSAVKISTFRLEFTGDATLVNANTVTTILSKLEQRLDTRTADLERARAKQGADALVARVTSEVQDLQIYRDTVKALVSANEKSSENLRRFENAKAELVSSQTEIGELTQAVADVQEQLFEAKADVTREEQLKTEAQSLTEELKVSLADIERDRTEWEAAKGDLENELDSERTARFVEREKVREEIFDLERALEIERKKVDQLELDHRTERDTRDGKITALRRELEDARDAKRDAEAKLETALTVSKRALETGTAAAEEVEATLREQLLEAEQRRFSDLADFERKNVEAKEKREKLQAEADEKANALNELKSHLESVEFEVRRATEEASEQRSLAQAKSAALEAALMERDAERTNVVALESLLECSEAKLLVSQADAKKASRDLETVKKDVSLTRDGLKKREHALAEACTKAAADAAAAAEARNAASSLRDQLLEAEKRRDEASAAAAEERDALGAETLRLEKALLDARDALKRVTIDSEKDIADAVVAAEARVERLAAAAADVDARVKASQQTPADQLTLESEAHRRRAEQLQQQLVDAKASSLSTEKHLKSRVEEMKERIAVLELSLAKKNDAKEAKRLRAELLALERERVEQISVLETRVRDIQVVLRDARRDTRKLVEQKSTQSSGSVQRRSNKTLVQNLVAALRDARHENTEDTNETLAKENASGLAAPVDLSENQTLDPSVVSEIESTLRSTVSELETRLAAAEKTVAEKTAALVSVAGDETKATAEASELKSLEIEKMEQRLRDKYDALEAKREEVKAAELELVESAKSAAASVDASAELSKLQSTLDATTGELRVAAKARDAAVAVTRGLERRLQEANGKLAEVSYEMDVKRKQVDDLQTRMNEANAALSVSSEARAVNKKLIATLESQLVGVNEELSTVQTANQALVEEVKVLREEVDEKSPDESSTEPVSEPVTEKTLAVSRAELVSLESQLLETKQMYEVTLGSLRAEKEEFQEKLATTVAEASLKSATDSKKIAALRDAVQNANTIAEGLKLDLEAVRAAADVAKADANGTVDRLESTIAELEQRAERERELAAERLEQLETVQREELDNSSAETYETENDDTSDTDSQEEVAALRQKLVEMESDYEHVVHDMRLVEKDLRAELSKAQTQAANGRTLEATRDALEKRLQDAEASLQAERERAAAEATAASDRAEENVTQLQTQLEGLRATLESRDSALREASAAADALQEANTYLEQRLSAMEVTKRSDFDSVTRVEIAKLEADVRSARSALDEKDKELSMAVASIETANLRAEAAEAEAETLREKLVAFEELGAIEVLRRKEAEDRVEEGTSKEKSALPSLVSVELERRLEELTNTANARSVEIEKLVAEKVELEAEIELRKDTESARAAAEKEADALRAEVTELTANVVDLEKALQARDELKAQLSPEAAEMVERGRRGVTDTYGNTASTPPTTPSPWMNLFGGDDAKAAAAASVSPRGSEIGTPSRFSNPEEDAATLEVSVSLARLQIVLRHRERALAGLKRLETDGKALAPALESYRTEIKALEQEANEVRQELFKKDAQATELRGRLDVELNILKRESARAKARALTVTTDVTNALKQRADVPVLDPLDPAILLSNASTMEDLPLETLEDKLLSAQLKSTEAFDALGDTLGSAKEDGKGGFPLSSTGLSVNLIDVQFSIPFQTRVGQDLFVVGTWCDWDIDKGLALKWSDGDLWQGTMPLHPGYNYEYKYVVLERRNGSYPGQELGNGVDWGFAEPSLVAKPTSSDQDSQNNNQSAYAAVWQKGNNKALALDNISTKGLDHVKANDNWVADPKNSPIQLVGTDGKVKQIVGSTKLLMECVHRADEYLEEVKTQMEEMYDIAAEAIRKRKNVDDDDDDSDDDGLIIA